MLKGASTSGSCLVGVPNSLGPSRSSFPHERSHVHVAEPRKPFARASDLRRLRDRADRAIRLVRRLPEGLLPPLRPPPFLHARLPGERLPRRAVRPPRRRAACSRRPGDCRTCEGGVAALKGGGRTRPQGGREGEQGTENDDSRSSRPPSSPLSEATPLIPPRAQRHPLHQASLTPRTSSASRRPSPSRLSAMTVMTMASPGKTLIHHA